MSIILRVFSKAGRSRVEIDSKKSFDDLRVELAKRLGLENANTVKLFLDDKFKKPIAARGGDVLSKIFKNGDILHVGNQDTVMTQLPKKREFVSIEENKEDSKMEDEEKKEEVRYDSYGKKLKPVEEKKEDDGPRKDSYGRELKPVEKKKDKK